MSQVYLMIFMKKATTPSLWCSDSLKSSKKKLYDQCTCSTLQVRIYDNMKNPKLY